MSDTPEKTLPLPERTNQEEQALILAFLDAVARGHKAGASRADINARRMAMTLLVNMTLLREMDAPAVAGLGLIIAACCSAETRRQVQGLLSMRGKLELREGAET